MGIIVGFILVLFVPACILLPIIILLQDSKGEGLSSSAFGGAGGSMQSVLGGQGAATFLSKVTTWLAIGFMVMALFLMRFYGETGGELKPLQEATPEVEVTITPPDETTEADTAETDGAGSSSESSGDVEEGAGK
ncbi:preprotein translocase subunit SecG [Candidatus Poribacteria bacterium]|nr:preprotein translocase subunit SecG [Candidatus Poribacteria bacterium]